MAVELYGSYLISVNLQFKIISFIINIYGFKNFMNIKKIIYITVAYYEEQFANVIQTKQMIRSFRNVNLEVIELWKSNKRSKNKENCYKFYVPRIRLFHYVYLILISFFAWIKFKNQLNISYFTRSIFVCFTLQILQQNKITLELHNSPSGILERFFYSFLSEKVNMIFISNSLKQYYAKIKTPFYSLVLHDGHSNKIVKKEKLKEHFSKWSKNREIKIGYFGRFSEQKGSQILKKLVRTMPYANFYFGTLNSNNLFGENIKENSYIPHERVFKKIKNLDFLLVLVVPCKDRSDISAFTSPLKLFEYASTGKCIIASNVKVLREHKNYNGLIFSKNSANDFKIIIDQMIQSPKKRYIQSMGALKLAEDYTWNKRALKVKERFFK